MTASEFAFLALGLVLGVASGSALFIVLGSRPPAREVRLTVEHDAVPRRASTLSSDAFATSPAEPARGGPADRRRMDRDAPPADPPARLPFPAFATAGVAYQPRAIDRTSVPFTTAATAFGGIPIVPERDPVLDALRVQAALTAERLNRVGLLTSTALLEGHAEPARSSTPFAERQTDPQMDREMEPDPDGDPIEEPPALTRILRGDHQALFATVAALAGSDNAERRPWQGALRGLAEGLVTRAISTGCLDFPVGNPFWDTFTTDQCRAIAGALAATGHRFDGVDGWADGRIPSYRDLTVAVAAIGLEPRRIRAWPTQEQIDSLYREVSVAADDFLSEQAPGLDLEEVQALAGMGGPERAMLWAEWPRVQAILLAPIAPA